jgi:hypothetical protein
MFESFAKRRKTDYPAYAKMGPAGSMRRGFVFWRRNSNLGGSRRQTRSSEQISKPCSVCRSMIRCFKIGSRNVFGDI